MSEVNERFGGSFDEEAIRRVEAGKAQHFSVLMRWWVAIIAIGIIYGGMRLFAEAIRSRILILVNPNLTLPPIGYIGYIGMIVGLIMGVRSLFPYARVSVRESDIHLHLIWQRDIKIEFSEIVAVGVARIRPRFWHLGEREGWRVSVCHRGKGPDARLYWTKVLGRGTRDIARALGAVIAHRADLAEMTYSEGEESPWRLWRRQGVEDLPPLEDQPEISQSRPRASGEGARASEINERYGEAFDEEYIRRIEAGKGVAFSRMPAWVSVSVLLVILYCVLVYIFTHAGGEYIGRAEPLYLLLAFGCGIVIVGILLEATSFHPFASCKVEESCIRLHYVLGKEIKIAFKEIASVTAARASRLGSRDLKLWGVSVCHNRAPDSRRWTKILGRNNPDLARALAAVIAHRADLSEMTRSEPDEVPWRSWKRAGVEELPVLKV